MFEVLNEHAKPRRQNENLCISNIVRFYMKHTRRARLLEKPIVVPQIFARSYPHMSLSLSLREHT